MRKLITGFCILMLVSWHPLAFTFSTGAAPTPNKTAASTWVFNSAVAGSSGQAHIICIAMDNIGTTSDGDKNDILSITDAAGNTYTQAGEFSNVQSGAGTGATVGIFYSTLSSAITTSTSITITFSAATSTAKCAAQGIFSMTSGNVLSCVTAANNTLPNDGADAGSLQLNGTVTSREYIFLRASAIENSSYTNTTTASWSPFVTGTTNVTSGGGAASNMAMFTEYRILTSTFPTASDPTVGAADIASLEVALYETAPPPVTRQVKLIN